MNDSDLPQQKKPFSLELILNRLHEIENKKEFPQPPEARLDQLVTRIKPGDFINWEGYADFELEFIYQEVALRSALFGWELPSFEQFVASFREHLAENPVYSIVSRVLDKRTAEWKKYSQEQYPHEKFVIPKFAPVIVNAINFELRGEGDSYSFMGLHFYDSLIEPNPFPIQKVRKVSKEEALKYLAWKINKYQQNIDAAMLSVDSKIKLYACVDARKQFRLAELGVALCHTDNPLEIMEKYKSESLVRPETGYFVLLPDDPKAFKEIGPKLVFIKDENSFKLNEYDVGKFIHLMSPNIFGETKFGQEINYRCFGVPYRNLALVEGIEAIEIYRPPTNLVKAVKTAELPFGQKPIETFLLKSG